MAKASVPTVRSRRLGTALRGFREHKQLTLEAACAGLERSLSSLSKAENGRTKLYSRDVRGMLDFYGVTDERVREGLVSLARDSHKRGWWDRYSDVLSPSYLDFISLEADAAGIRAFETILVPGLLQTPDYARAAMSAVPTLTGPLDVEPFLAVRTARQEVLTRHSPPRLWAVLDEAVLRRQIGGRETMHAQLRRLVEASAAEHIIIQVLPYATGAHAGIAGPFTILEFPEFADLDVVLVETLTGGLYLESEEEIRMFSLVFDHLRMSALAREDSRELIEHIAKDLE
jgi:hypothetical protein